MLADLVDHVIGVDPDRDRITTAIIDTATQGHLDLDAVRAAREVLSRHSWSTPRARGIREGLRALLVARDSAKIARVAAINVLRALVLTAPIELREELRTLTFTALVDRCRRLRPDTTSDPELSATKHALGSAATRVAQLTNETRDLQAAMRELVVQICPALLDEPGVGTLLAAQVIISWSHPGRCRSEAAFARLGGVAPVEATSGQTQTRYRLSRGGDRQLNRASTKPSSSGPSATPKPAPTSTGASPRARPNAKRCAASSATSPVTSSASWNEPNFPLDTDRSISTPNSAR